ncbi:unnamed protein product [Adineta steineri]|uniref:G-protein coupled receptors family 1 profile domain-containing protein n=1 Tax=Adineta steineri TaxID=433720 RepID=A0A818HVB6_9BILA|nr:unnamed protein product [Adineta steineri]
MAQILLAIFRGPLRLYFYRYNGCLPVAGTPLCQFNVYLIYIPTQINNFLVVQLSIERLLLVVKPLIFHRARHQNCSRAIFIHYIGLFVATVFPCFYYPIIMQYGAGTIDLNNPSLTQTCDLWYSREINELFDLLITFVPYFLILISCLSIIGLVLYRKYALGYRQGRQVEKELDTNLIQNQLNDFKLKLIEERPHMLSMIDIEIISIINYDEIQKLFILIETVIDNNKKNLLVDELKDINTCLNDVYINENKSWQSFNAFPQFIKENHIEIYFNNNNNTDEVKEEEVEDSQDIVLYKSIFKEHTTLNSTDEFIILAKFTGFRQTFEEISETVKSILHSLLINWEKSADAAEAIALERFI